MPTVIIATHTNTHTQMHILVSEDNVGGENELDALGLSLGLKLLGKLDLVGLNEGRASAQALRLQEREHHATTCTKESLTESTKISNLLVLKYPTLGA
jgi:hypothetical protein